MGELAEEQAPASLGTSQHSGQVPDFVSHIWFFALSGDFSRPLSSLIGSNPLNSPSGTGWVPAGDVIDIFVPAARSPGNRQPIDIFQAGIQPVFPSGKGRAG